MSSSTLSRGPAPDRSGSGHARTFAETEAWLAPLLERVPISRVHNAGALGTVPFPVFIAVTPLARDLTVHAGKGETAQAARLSAIMEAIERVSAEQLPEARPLRASYRELRSGQAVVDPRDFDLPFDTTFTEGKTFTWARATELQRGEPALVAADLVLSPALEGITSGVETNGLASGNTITEAVAHALYEVIERDAYSRETFHLLHHDPLASRSRPIRVIGLGSLPVEARQWVQALRAQQLRVILQDLTTELGVPVIMATVLDLGFPGSEGGLITAAGLGASLDAERALMRALTEAVQSHTATLLGARDTFEGLRRVPERPAMLSRRVDLLFAEPTMTFAELPSRGSGDLHDDVLELLARLRAVGHDRCFVVDLTRPDLGVPVVRVLVPGLAMPYGDSARRPTRRLLGEILPEGLR